MDNKLFITLGLLAILLDFASCFFIRDMIWSIVWCDMGGKYNKLMKLKQGQNIFSRLNMQYLQNFTHQNIKQFHFWINVKRIHFAIMIVNIFAILSFTIFYRSISKIANIYCMGYLILSFLIATICAFQFDINRNTKYDRKRISKKKK